jgi:hypothetical protein
MRRKDFLTELQARTARCLPTTLQHLLQTWPDGGRAPGGKAVTSTSPTRQPHAVIASELSGPSHRGTTCTTPLRSLRTWPHSRVDSQVAATKTWPASASRSAGDEADNCPASAISWTVARGSLPDARRRTSTILTSVSRSSGEERPEDGEDVAARYDASSRWASQTTRSRTPRRTRRATRSEPRYAHAPHELGWPHF